MTRRLARQSLVALLVALHAAVALCGPCLHELPGMSHEASSVSNLPQGQNPLKASHDSSDTCPICHFLAQGQLAVSPTWARVELRSWEWIASVSAPIKTARHSLESRPRAPPVVGQI